MGEEACWFHKALDGAAHGAPVSGGKANAAFPKTDDGVGRLILLQGRATTISSLEDHRCF